MSEHRLGHLNRTPDAAAQRMRWILLAVTPLVILSQFFRSSGAVIAPSLMSDLALSAEDIAKVSGSFFLIFAVMQIPLGVLFDRFGARLITPITIGGLNRCCRWRAEIGRAHV